MGLFVELYFFSDNTCLSASSEPSSFSELSLNLVRLAATVPFIGRLSKRLKYVCQARKGGSERKGKQEKNKPSEVKGTTLEKESDNKSGDDDEEDPPPEKNCASMCLSLFASLTPSGR